MQKNMAANDVITKAFETGDTKAMDSVVADDFVDHSDHGDIKGRDSLKAMVNMIHTTMKDMKMEMMRSIADDEYVSTWMRYSGTSDGSMGMPKGPYDMHAIELTKFKDGKATDHWSFMDMRDMAKMMQSPPPNLDKMDKMNKMDTSKMKK
jgi:Predicted ester cyclase